MSDDLGYGSRESTVTDFGGTVRSSLPPLTLAMTCFGTTMLGAAKAFTLSAAGAVSVSPLADRNATPAISASKSTGLSGSRFVISNQSLPNASRAASASTRGRLTLSWV